MESNNEILARLDERSKRTHEELIEVGNKIEKHGKDLVALQRDVDIKMDNLKDAMIAKIDASEKVGDEKYVKKDQFAPVKAFVYGLIGIILVAVAGALLNLIIGTQPPSAAEPNIATIENAE